MITKALDALIVAATATLLLIAATGGIDVSMGGVPVRVHDWTRPALVLAVLCVLRFRWFCRRPDDGSPSAAEARHRESHAAVLTLLAVIAAAIGVYTTHHVRVAGGLDSYGYVSTAHLIAAGRLHEPQPIAAVLPFDNPMNAAAPLGHVAAADGKTSVPRFPLGLPALMAVALWFGAAGPFFVPLAFACGAIAAAYLIARQQSRPPAALFAAALVAVEPAFAAYALQPMSDVPATAWLLFALYLVWRGRGVGAGLSAGMAMLTRPALMPAAAAIVAVAWSRFGKSRSTLAAAGIVAAFVSLQLILNAWLYGDASASGYGATAHMFELTGARLAAALYNFGKWLTYSHTPAFWVLWPAALAILRRERWAWEASAVAAAAAAPYLFYIVFDDWESTRFLLPSIVLILILSAVAVSRLVRLAVDAADGDEGRHLKQYRLAAALAAAALICAAGSHWFLEREGIFRLASLESKYALVGEWFERNTSDRVVVLAALHSGTIRLYGHRQTIRWDQIPEGALNATLGNLIASGYEPYLALDLPSEPPSFEARFSTEPINMQQVARVRVVNIYRFVSAY